MRYEVARLTLVNCPDAVPAYSVYDMDAEKLVSLHPFSLIEEAEEEARTRNEVAPILLHWPDARDPEVLELLEDAEFGVEEQKTYAYRVHRASERIARSRAGLAPRA